MCGIHAMQTMKYTLPPHPLACRGVALPERNRSIWCRRRTCRRSTRHERNGWSEDALKATKLTNDPFTELVWKWGSAVGPSGRCSEVAGDTTRLGVVGCGALAAAGTPAHRLNWLISKPLTCASYQELRLRPLSLVRDQHRCLRRTLIMPVI